MSKLLVVVNKMDDPTVNWAKERYSTYPSLVHAPAPKGLVISYALNFTRYDEIGSKMVPFLKTSGYNVKKGMQGLFFSQTFVVLGFRKYLISIFSFRLGLFHRLANYAGFLI